MWQCQLWRVHLCFVVGYNVNVDDTVVIDTVFALFGAAHFAFNLLGGVQQLQWRERCLDCYNHIEKRVLAIEAPWSGFDDGRLHCDGGKSGDLPYCLIEIGLLIAEVCAEG